MQNDAGVCVFVVFREHILYACVCECECVCSGVHAFEFICELYGHWGLWGFEEATVVAKQWRCNLCALSGVQLCHNNSSVGGQLLPEGQR